MLSYGGATSRLVVGGLAVGAMFFGSASAMAEPTDSDAAPPNCTAADLAGVSAGVAAATSAYLFSHPDVNDFFTGLKGQSRSDISEQLQAYMDANPDVHADLRGIRQPLKDIADRCGFEPARLLEE